MFPPPLKLKYMCHYPWYLYIFTWNFHQGRYTKHCSRKGCVLFVFHISSDKWKGVEDVEVLKGYLVLKQFQDVFPTYISELPPHREMKFSIELVPRATPTSNSPYKISTPKLVELKLHLKEMIYNGYIMPSVLPCGTPIFLVNKKDGTLRLCIDYR